MSLYSNYLTEVGKLVYIIGEIEATSNFKKQLEVGGEYRHKCFFKCVDELPVNAYKKTKMECRRMGIIKTDWFNKVLDRAPLMIFMMFNCSQPLDDNEKWEDRLSIMLKKINKVNDILKSSGREEVMLKILVIVSKEAVMSRSSTTMNLPEKINAFLKHYEKEVEIFQMELLSKEINKNRGLWFNLIDKAYDRKFRSVSKRMQETFVDENLGCQIKLAIMGEIMQKKESYSLYEDAYRSLHYRFQQQLKSLNDITSFGVARQYRVLADIVMLRKLMVKINTTMNYSMLHTVITEHLSFFSNKQSSKHFFFFYEDLLWKENFIHNLLEVLHTNDYLEVIDHSHFTELVNGVIGYSYQLSQAAPRIKQLLSQQEVKGRLIPIQEEFYIGSRNYSMGLEITDVDVIFTEMTELIEKQKDYITRGMQVLTRYKSLKTLKVHQITFMNVYLIRFCLADAKFDSVIDIYEEIVMKGLKNWNLPMLNELAVDVKKDIQKMGLTKEIKFWALLTIISDYYQNQMELENYGSMLVSALAGDQAFSLLSEDASEKQPSQQVSLMNLPIQSKSFIFNCSIELRKDLHPIEEELSMKLKLETYPTFNNENLKYFLDVVFEEESLNRSGKFNRLQFKPELELTGNIIDLTFDPLQLLSKDGTVSISHVVVRIEGKETIEFTLQHLGYEKYRSCFVYTKLHQPQISVKLPYDILFMNETVKFLIEITPLSPQTRLDAKFTIKEDEAANKTEVYVNLDEHINFVNTKCYQTLHFEEKKWNSFYLKCNQVGPKVLRFDFILMLEQKIGQVELKNTYKVSKDVNFKVNTLFKSIKILKEYQTGNELHPKQIPLEKKILLNYSLRSTQLINIIELNQHKNPNNFIQYHKSLTPIKQFMLSPDEKMKNLLIFSLGQEALGEEQDIFVISFYVRWMRVDMDMKLNIMDDSVLENVYVEQEVKVGVRRKKVEIQYEEGKVIKKRVAEVLKVKYRNMTNDRIHVRSIMENNQTIMRVGRKTSEGEIQPYQTLTLSFPIIAIRAGYYSYPQMHTFINGLQLKNEQCRNILCVL